MRICAHLFGKETVTHGYTSMMRKKFPIILQHDSKDCGPTCLQMVYQWHGGDLPISQMRDLCDLSIDGVSLQGMARAAEYLQMDAMATHVSADVLDELPLPFIAHWLDEHFVTVIDVRANRITVADPELGRISYRRADFIRHWRGKKVFGELQISDSALAAPGAVLLLSPKPAFQPATVQPRVDTPTPAWRPLKDVPAVLRRARRRTAFVAIVFPIVMLTTIALPLIMQRVIDQGIVARDADLLALLLGGYLALLLSRNVVAALRDLALLHIGTRISIALVHGFMSHLLRLKMSFFERRSLGDLIQRQQDHRRIEQFLTTQSLPLFFSLITFAIFGVMLAGYNVRVLGVVVVSAALTILWTAHFRKYRRQFDQQQFEIEGVVQAHTVEIMSAVPDLKAFGMTGQKANFYRSLLTRRYDTTLRALRLDEMQSIGAILLMDIGEIVALYLAGRMVIAGAGSLGDFVAIMYILGQLRGPLTRLVPFFQSAQDAWLSLGRLQSLGEEPNEPKAGPADARLAAMPASGITLNDVCFRYNRLHDSNVLDALNLTIPAGKVTAIVGESGSGKSTLIKLLARFHEPVSGHISYGGLALTDTSADAWRQRVGLVLQDGMIFNATLSYNVTLSHGDADPARLQRALDVANVSAFLDMLPLGVLTSIGRAGWQLSAGQQQRVLIARALYRDPEILIFDEATSALDSNNEADITSGLATVFEGRTTVVISHRLSTIRHADQIIVLKAGRVTEVGNHDALVAKRGAYFEIFNRQLNLKENNP